MTREKYKITITACFIGYIVQAIINNFAPLLFITFQKSYNIPLSQITLLVTANFLFQLFVDLMSAKLIDKIGYRTSMIIAHTCCAVGLISLTILPELFSSSFAGLLISVMIYASGPTIAGMISDACGGNLKIGILCAIAFPVVLLLGVFLCKKISRKKYSL